MQAISFVRTRIVRIPSIVSATVRTTVTTMVVTAGVAQAQISKVNSVMQAVSDILTGVSVIAFTIALSWAGYKMAFQHAKWSEISNIVIGAIIVGGASGIASWLMSS